MVNHMEKKRLRRDFIEACRDGEYKKALFFGKQLLHVHMEDEIGSNMEYAIDMSNMAIAYDQLGQYTRAAEYYKRAGEIKKACGGESLSYADTLNNLAIVYCITQRHEESLRLHSKVLEVRDLKLGREHKDYIHTLYNIGNTYYKMGDYSKALEFHEKALKRAQASTKLDSLDLADIHSAIAKVYQKRGNYKRAILYFEMSLDLIEKARGCSGYYYMSQVIAMARVCEKTGFLDLAVEYYERALAIRKDIMSVNHLDYINGMNHLGRLYRKNHQLDLALQTHQAILESIAKLLGKDHLFYSDILGEMSLDYCAMKNYDQAFFLAKHAIELKEVQTTEGDGQLASSLWVMGNVLIGMGEMDQALQHLFRALEDRIKAYGKADEACADIMSHIGVAMEQLGAYEGASYYIMDALAVRQNCEQFKPDLYMQDIERLLKINRKQKEMIRGVGICLEAAKIMKDKFGVGHPHYAAVLAQLGQAYFYAGDCHHAMEALEDSLRIQKETLDEDTPSHLTTLEGMANVCRFSGEYKRAIAYYQERNDMNFEETASEQLEAAKTLLDIAICYQLWENPKRAIAYFSEGEEKARRSGLQEQKSYQGLLKLYERAKDKKSCKTFFKNQLEEKPGKRHVCGQEAAEAMVAAFRQMEGHFGREEDGAHVALTIGDIYERLEEGDEALYWYALAEKIGNGSAYVRACQRRGELYFKRKDYLKAAQKFTNAKEYLAEYGEMQNETYASLLKGLGNCYLHAGETEYAIRIYLAWQELYLSLRLPSNDEYWAAVEQTAKLCMDEKKYPEAIRQYEMLEQELRSREGESVSWSKLLIKMVQTCCLIYDFDRAQIYLEKLSNSLKSQQKRTETQDKLYDQIGRLFDAAGNQEKAREILLQQYRSGFQTGRQLTKSAKQILLRLLEEKGEEQVYLAVKNGDFLADFC